MAGSGTVGNRVFSLIRVLGHGESARALDAHAKNRNQSGAIVRTPRVVEQWLYGAAFASESHARMAARKSAYSLPNAASHKWAAVETSTIEFAPVRFAEIDGKPSCALPCYAEAHLRQPGAYACS